MGCAKSAMLILLLLAMLISSCTAELGREQSVSAEETTMKAGPGCQHGEASLIFESWMLKHGKVYETVAEKEKRLTIFEDNLRFITNRNAENLNYRLGLNRFADLSLHEYGEICHGADPRPPKKHVFMTSSDRYKISDGDVLPKAVDWRNKGAVTEVKDQGNCRSCWAFSTVGAVEGLNKIVTGDLVTLSEQDLINCNKENNGCGGGKVETAYEFIMNNGGLGTDNDYPYNALNGVCDVHLKENSTSVMIDGYENLPANDGLINSFLCNRLREFFQRRKEVQLQDDLKRKSEIVERTLQRFQNDASENQVKLDAAMRFRDSLARDSYALAQATRDVEAYMRARDRISGHITMLKGHQENLTDIFHLQHLQQSIGSTSKRFH